MNMLKQLNAAIQYIEANLCAEFDLDTAAGIACVTAVCCLQSSILIRQPALPVLLQTASLGSSVI